MAARGEKVPVVTTQPKKPELPSKAAAMLNGTKPPPQSQTQPEPPASKPIPGNFKGPAPIGPAPQEAPAVAMPSSLATMPTALLAASKLVHSPGANVQANVVSASQDENLRNMMMSWYYAGYHTGLYEGQQKVLAQWQESLQVEEGAGEVEG